MGHVIGTLVTNMGDHHRHLPEQSRNCLTCACENRNNSPARDLLEATGAMSINGILAAVFMADSEEHAALVALAREAIARQREWCMGSGPLLPAACRRYVSFPGAMLATLSLVTSTADE